MPSKPKATDFHPHDRFVASAVRQLAQIERQLSVIEAGTRAQSRSVMAYLQDLVPWWGRPEPTEAPLRAIWSLLQDPDFVALLPFVLERFNSAGGYMNLPNRGRLRNLDRQVLDTYYTPLDLARWLASQTTERACGDVRHLLATGVRGKADEALRRLLSLRICDLSCGAGILLRESLEPIAAAYTEIYDTLGKHESAKFASVCPFFSRGFPKLQALLTNVYGIDISSRAVESARTVLSVWAADELHSAGLTATAAEKWLGLNIRVGSGSHWSIGVEDVFQVSIADSLHRAALERGDLRRAILELADSKDAIPDYCTVSSNYSGVEVVRMFPEVFVGQNPGFACIVGNPPFGRLPEEVKILKAHRPPTCFSLRLQKELLSRWQYPRFVEGLYRLTRRGEFSAIVTPLNLAYGREFANLRATIERAPLRSTFIFFDRSPDALFGDKVKTRNVVLLVEPSERDETEIWTTHLLRWTRTRRADLWKQVEPAHLSTIGIRSFVPKLGTSLEVECWKRLRCSSDTIRSKLLKSNFGRSRDAAVHVNATAYNWLPAFRHVPSADASLVSPSMRTYYFRSVSDADLVYSCLVSSLAFWLWTAESDGFHVTERFILGLPFVPDIFSGREVQVLSELGRAHDRAIRDKPTVKSNAGLKILNFNRQSAAHISHQIDEVMARALELPRVFLDLVQKRVTNLVYVGREQTRATESGGLEKEGYAEVR